MVFGSTLRRLRYGALPRPWRSIVLLRNSSSKSPYSNTVLLPKTTFTGKVSANIAEKEKSIQEAAGFDKLYEWQRKHNEGKAPFILHDGPPYANGDVHVGHALNKILKDITTRYKMLRGYQVHYVPGWDCHGLPIEVKAIKSADFRRLKPSEIRSVAYQYAKNTIAKQRDAFKRWGVMANWNDDGCYFTYSKDFEAKELQAFYEIFKKGYIYRDLKPVYWSPSSGTALAEAELEYNPSHKSRSAYVAFPLKMIPSFLSSYTTKKSASNISVIVWTTQPWTIPANQAVCYSTSDRYCLVEADSSADQAGKAFIIGERQIPVLENILNSKLTTISSFGGGELEGCHCLHPMDEDISTPLLPSSHVTMEKGTGFVHVAPAHGLEDFELALKHDLKSQSHVDECGKFTAEAGYGLEGKFIFTEGNEKVVQKLKQNGNLVQEHYYEHSYPYDWRTKEPIFVRTSRQWFVETNILGDQAKGILDGVTITPPSGRASMLSHLKGRTFWCISRQRSWGVPIPVFYHKKTSEMLLTNASVQHVVSMIQEQGSDCWWNSQTDELLPQSVIDESDFKNCSPDDFEPGRDILDIWFDSGLTWAGVLGKSGSFHDAPVADLYLEGKDQYGGWFQSSLLTSTALRGTPPYKNLLVHGFVMSESGEKMSKSLGNIVDPMVVTDGGKNKAKDPPYGADVMRWWVVESNIHQEVVIGQKVLGAAKDSLNKIRLCVRFLLGNLSDFRPDENMISSTNSLRLLDRYMLHLLRGYSETVTEAYDKYEYVKVSRTMLNFITKLSSFYFTVIKDRLYCDEQKGHLRRSCQSVLYHSLNVLAKSAAPILPHTMEELVKHHPCSGMSSIFKAGWCDIDTREEWRDETLASDFEDLLKIRDAFISSLEGQQSVIYDTHIKADGSLTGLLQRFSSSGGHPFTELREILGCSGCVLVGEVPKDYTKLVEVDCNRGSCSLAVTEAAMRKCPRCRCYTAKRSTEPCERCVHVLAGPWAA